jgi:hypothetical protein
MMIGIFTSSMMMHIIIVILGGLGRFRTAVAAIYFVMPIQGGRQ